MQLRDPVRELVSRPTSVVSLDQRLPQHVDRFAPAVVLAFGNLPNSTPSVLDVLD